MYFENSPPQPDVMTSMDALLVAAGETYLFVEEIVFIKPTSYLISAHLPELTEAIKVETEKQRLRDLVMFG